MLFLLYIEKLKTFFSNEAYATIIAAIIGAVALILVSIIEIKKKEKKKSSGISITGNTKSTIKDLYVSGNVSVDDNNQLELEGAVLDGKQRNNSDH